MLEGQKQKMGWNGKFSKDHYNPKSVHKIIDPKYSATIQQRNLSILTQNCLTLLSSHQKGKFLMEITEKDL